MQQDAVPCTNCMKYSRNVSDTLYKHSQKDITHRYRNILNRNDYLYTM